MLSIWTMSPWEQGEALRSIGRRTERPISLHASAEALIEGARFNEEIHRLPTGNTSFIPKGLYRFKSHEEANLHQEMCIAAGMAKIAKDRA